ncbi:hypothetical protein [Candidatus Uabimicrobium sp. HlEnr_7]|uniref:hypothetical protein n=1 Tax=Candidatus Uabimicrobium helgolandensis TaxID=3095367 RepID=UPI003558254E
MKRKIFSLFLAILGFVCISLSHNYMLNAVVAKVVVLAISSSCLIYSLTKNTISMHVTTNTTEKDIFDYENVVNSNSTNKAAKIASLYILNGDGKKGIAIYKELMKRSSDAKTIFLSEMAAAEYSMGNYKSSINYHIQALKNGADEDTTDDYIWQAFCEIYKTTQDEDYVKNYFEWMPQGAYHAEAKALLIGHYV